jgi:hypothetical protein
MDVRLPLGTRAGMAVLLVALTLVGAANPAGAHAGDVEQATNYQTSITSTPDAPGLTVQLGDAGSTIQVTYDGPGEVVVYGYGVDPEPYLRIGADGVHRNLQSNATYVNESSTADTPIPPGVDPDNPPEWERVSTTSTYRWHDHRSHWMGVVDPPAVAAAPDQRHVVIEDWVIPLTVDGRTAEIRGDVTWVPGPSPWPWAALIVAGAGIVAALGLLTRPGLAIEAGLLAGLGCSAIALGHLLAATPAPWWWLIGVASVVGLLSAAVLVLARGRRRTGTILAGVGGLGAAGLIGVVDRAWLVRSLLPVDVDPAVARTVVAGSLVLGGGLVLASAGWLLGAGRHAAASARPGPPPPEPAAPPGVTVVDPR